MQAKKKREDSRKVPDDLFSDGDMHCCEEGDDMEINGKVLKRKWSGKVECNNERGKEEKKKRKRRGISRFYTRRKKKYEICNSRRMKGERVEDAKKKREISERKLNRKSNVRNNNEISTSSIMTRSAKEKEKKMFGNLERKMIVRVCTNKGLRRKRDMERNEDKDKRNVYRRKVRGKEEEKIIEGRMEEEENMGMELNLLCKKNKNEKRKGIESMKVTVEIDDEEENYKEKGIRKEKEKKINGDGWKKDRRKEERKIDNKEDRKVSKNILEGKTGKEVETDRLRAEDKRKMIRRAKSKKGMENTVEENIKVNKAEEDINMKKGEKEEGNENKKEDKIEDDGKEKDEEDKKKSVECEGEEVISSVTKKKQRKRKEIYTLGVRSGGDFVFRTYSIVRRIPKKYKCSLCKDIFKTVKDRNDHVRNIHNIDSFKCPDCEKIFKTESSMKRHGFEHKEGGKKYACSVCDKFFYFSSHLKRHEATHSEEPLFKCVYSECHTLKGWRDMSDYNRHMLRYHKREDKG